jgi:hypothetical protein
VSEHKRQQNADAGRRKTGNDRDGMNMAFLQYCQDEGQIMGFERLFGRRGRAFEHRGDQFESDGQAASPAQSDSRIR